MVTTDDDAEALVTHLRTLARTCGFPRITEAARVIEQQAARITDLETQVAGDAVRLQAAVDQRVRDLDERATRDRAYRRAVILEIREKWEASVLPSNFRAWLESLLDKDHDHAD